MEIQKQHPVFEFSGNSLCLDFINTVHDRPSGMPLDLLTNYSDLLQWCQQTHLLTEQTFKQLSEEAAQKPEQAVHVLTEAITLREVLYRIFLAVSQGVPPPSQDMMALNTTLTIAMPRLQVIPEVHGFIWDWADKERSLDSILWPIVRSATSLLTSKNLDRVHVCAASDCNWLFVDISKNGKRRWCDMKNCGNRAKVRRFHERKKLVSAD